MSESKSDALPLGDTTIREGKHTRPLIAQGACVPHIELSRSPTGGSLSLSATR